MRVPGRSVGQDLSNLANRSVSNIRMSKLAKMFGSDVERRIQADLENEREYNLNIPHIEHVKRLVAEELEHSADEMNAHLPVTSVFDALQTVKASKDVNKDMGLRALKGHLETIWNKNRSANITAKSFLELKDHYTRNYPRSAVGEVLVNISKEGYLTLPVSDLIDIASQIKTQKDYNDLILKHGLQTNKPNNVKARRFILAIVNKESE